MENIVVLRKIGEKTLYLGGSEYIATSTVTGVLGLLGIEVVVKNQFMGILYAIGLICIAAKLLVGMEKYLLERIYGLPNHLLGVWDHNKTEIGKE